MLKSYASKYPNHVHQLAVVVSQHYYQGQDGLLKYQRKPFGIKLNTLNRAKHQHLVIYALRDHCSDLYYAEVFFGMQHPPLESFLGRAWREKTDFPLCGMPELLLIPKDVADYFHTVVPALEKEGVQCIHPTSGFQSGSPALVRKVERSLIVADLAIFNRTGNEADVAWAVRGEMMRNAQSLARTRSQSKLEMWLQHVSNIRFPSPGFGEYRS